MLSEMMIKVSFQLLFGNRSRRRRNKGYGSNSSSPTGSLARATTLSTALLLHEKAAQNVHGPT